MSGSDIQKQKPSQSNTDLREVGNHNKEVITAASSESPLLPGSHRTWSLISSFEEVEGTVNFNLCFTPMPIFTPPCTKCTLESTRHTCHFHSRVEETELGLERASGIIWFILKFTRYTLHFQSTFEFCFSKVASFSLQSSKISEEGKHQINMIHCNFC